MIDTTSTVGLTSFRSGGATVTPEGARRVAEEFEAMFISEMLGPVFESLDTDGLFGGGQGEKIYRSLMVEEYGKAIAKAGGIGIADTVRSEILRMQENQA